MALRKQPQHCSQTQQQDESLKVCQATFAAGKQPELYNSAGELGSISSVCGERQRRNMTINEAANKGKPQ